MKKFNKIISIALLSVLALPTNIFALNQDVGVKVKGDVSISAITTISSDITIDVANKTTNSAYIELQNKSTVPLSVKVTDIEALTEGAPSTFVDGSEYLYNAGVSDTESKIGFSISKDGLAAAPNNTVNYILPDTEIDLGVVSAKSYYEGLGGPDYLTVTLDNSTELTYYPYQPYFDDALLVTDPIAAATGRELYRLGVNNGYAWTKSDVSFYYGITMVVGAATEEYDRNPIPELGIDGINISLSHNASISTNYVEVYLDGFNGENHRVNSYGLKVLMDGVTDTGSGAYGEYLGSFLHKNQDTEEVLGTSYFFEITDVRINEQIKSFSSSSTKYLDVKVNLGTTDSIDIIASDILTNKNLNQ